MKLSDLTPDPANRRKHTAKNLGMLQEALRVVGASRSIVIDETGEILAGNGVVEAARAVGLDQVQIVEADGRTIVAVRRTGLTPEEKRQLAMYDNRVAELAEWNWDQLGADQTAGLDLAPWFSAAELAEGLPGADQPGLTDPRGDYHWQHEPCWYAIREGAPGQRTSDRTQTTLWPIATREDAGHTHGTQKPVECMARPMRNHVAPAVYDPFVGSGTSVIAAQMLQRRCFAMDLEPSYVQVTIDRWQAFTGLTAEALA